MRLREAHAKNRQVPQGDGLDNTRKNLIGRESPKSQLRSEIFSFGYLALAIWPLRRAISQWQSRNPDTHLRFSLGQLAKSDIHEKAFFDTISRLSILGSGKESEEIRRQLTPWLIGGLVSRSLNYKL